VNIRALRAELAAAVRRAEAGERIVISVGGRPVAQLGPVEPVAGRTSIDDLAARGLVVAARRPDRPSPELVVALRVGTRLDRLAAEIRG